MSSMLGPPFLLNKAEVQSATEQIPRKLTVSTKQDRDRRRTENGDVILGWTDVVS